LLSFDNLILDHKCSATELSKLFGVVVRWDGDHSEERSLLLGWLFREIQFSSDQISTLGIQMLVKNDLIHSFGEVDVYLIKQGCGIRGRFTSQSLTVLGHRKNAIDLVGINFRNLMLWHVFNIIAIFYERVGHNTLVESSLESSCENLWVFFIKQYENSVESALFFGVLPETVITLSSWPIAGNSNSAPVAKLVLITPQTLSTNAFFA
jgi:hypothetical protein